MKLETIPAYPTLIGRSWVPDAEAMNQDLQTLILAEEAKYVTLGRSNIGGWHSRTDFLNRAEPAVEALTNWVTWALREMIDATAGPGSFTGRMSVSAWATICRNGAYHAPHSHPDSAWSGVYYVDAGTNNPDRSLSGVLEFLDPRAGVEAVTAPGDPYGDPVRVRPKAGLLVVFPSWLYHWVHPYAGETPRIAVSFNATLGVPAKDLNATRRRIFNSSTLTDLMEPRKMIRRASPRLSAAFGPDVSTLFATSSYGQAPASSPSDLESETEAMKIENVALQQELRKIEEQQSVLRELVNRLLGQLDEPTIAEGRPPAPPVSEAGPPGEDQTFDNGGELSASQFVIPRKLML